MPVDHGFETRSKFYRLASTAKRLHDLYEEIDRLETEETALSDELGPIAVAAGVKVGDVLDVGDVLLRLMDENVFEHVAKTSIYALDFPAPEPEPDDQAIEEAAAHAAIEDAILGEQSHRSDGPTRIDPASLKYCQQVGRGTRLAFAGAVKIDPAALNHCGSPTCDVCGGDRIVPAEAVQSVEDQR